MMHAKREQIESHAFNLLLYAPHENKWGCEYDLSTKANEVHTKEKKNFFFEFQGGRERERERECKKTTVWYLVGAPSAKLRDKLLQLGNKIGDLIICDPGNTWLRGTWSSAWHCVKKTTSSGIFVRKQNEGLRRERGKTKCWKLLI